MNAGKSTSLLQVAHNYEEQGQKVQLYTAAIDDRYGVGRSTNSDGRRNHTRIAAELDCQRGDYQKGIAALEDLLRRKAFTVPPPAVPDTVPPLESPEYGV